jgi:long-chain acyl-CoA synthetase
MNREKLISLYAQTFRENWDKPAFSDFQGAVCSYGEAAQLIRQIHCYFRESGIKKDDKVAILGRNSSNWAISFLAISGYGAVSVPVLPDFNPEDIHHILNHSESVFLFAADNLFEKLVCEKIPEITGLSVSVISLDYISTGRKIKKSGKNASARTVQEFQLLKTSNLMNLILKIWQFFRTQAEHQDFRKE